MVQQDDLSQSKSKASMAGDSGDNFNVVKEQVVVHPPPLMANNNAISKVDPKVVGSEGLHGEWLVVTRKKRNGKSGKGINVKGGKLPMGAATKNNVGAIHKADTFPMFSNSQGGEKEVMNDTLITKKRLRIGTNDGTIKEGVLMIGIMGGTDSLNSKTVTMESGKTNMGLDAHGVKEVFPCKAHNNFQNDNAKVDIFAQATNETLLGEVSGNLRVNDDGDSSMDCH
ncbi:unnamed protein product [Lupinus luteus]|uniref:Uncharacterized protein n=1 Tax=Lupinus luteus TaxID=3873 RepID=A0AAV1VR04_LUPLU